MSIRKNLKFYNRMLFDGNNFQSYVPLGHDQKQQIENILKEALIEKIKSLSSEFKKNGGRVYFIEDFRISLTSINGTSEEWHIDGYKCSEEEVIRREAERDKKIINIRKQENDNNYVILSIRHKDIEYFLEDVV